MKMGNYMDCCEWDRVKCDENEKVTKINWLFNYILNFDGGSIDISWIPEMVEYFCIEGQGLEGTVNLTILPRKMKELWLNRNKLTGQLDFSRLPPEIFKINAVE